MKGKRMEKRLGKSVIMTVFMAVIMLSVIMLFMLSEVAAIGISPSIRKVYFEPGLDKEYYVHIINNEKKDMNVSLSVGGSMKEYIILEEDRLELKSYEPRIKAYYRLNLPEEMLPGTWKGEIVLEEEAEEIQFSQESIVKAKMSLASEIDIVVVPEGKYIEAELEAMDTEKTGNLDFRIDIDNIGSRDIFETRAEIEVNSPTGELETKLNTGIAYVKKHSKTQLNAATPVSVIGLEQGEYHAKARVYYDGLVLEREDDFLIGEPTINLNKICMNPAGNDTYKFNFTLMSNWNKIITDVYIELDVFDKNGDNTLSTKSAPFDVNPYENKTSYLYGDINNLNESKIFVKVIYGSEIMQYEYLPDEIMEPRGNSKVNEILIRVLLIFMIVIISSLHIHRIFIKNKRKIFK